MDQLDGSAGSDGQAQFYFAARAGALSSKLKFWSQSWSFGHLTKSFEPELELFASIYYFGAGAGAFGSKKKFETGAGTVGSSQIHVVCKNP